MVSSCAMLYLFSIFIFLKKIFDSLEAVNKNRKIILVALYFLIWGEAANIRFLPECLCYIFHNVSPFLTQVLFFLFCSFRETTSGNEFSMAYTLCRWYCQVDDYDWYVNCSKHLALSLASCSFYGLIWNTVRIPVVSSGKWYHIFVFFLGCGTASQDLIATPSVFQYMMFRTS